MKTKEARRAAAMRELRTIPGVGPSIAEDLMQLGIQSVADLRGRDPEQLYRRRCAQQGTMIDRCLLYVFRCAVYFAGTPRPKPKLLLWWNWKDAPSRRRRA